MYVYNYILYCIIRIIYVYYWSIDINDTIIHKRIKRNLSYLRNICKCRSLSKPHPDILNKIIGESLNLVREVDRGIQNMLSFANFLYVYLYTNKMSVKAKIIKNIRKYNRIILYTL